MDKFTRQYLETALWSSTAADDEPMDKQTSEREAYSLSDIAPETVAQASADCAKFQRQNEVTLGIYGEANEDDTLAAHYFWLDRNGHGAGFQDRGPEVAANALAAASRAFGEVNLYEGDDGKIYA